MSKKIREHISIRLNPEKDADILRWYENLPHYERSGHVKDALNRYIGGRNKPAPFYRQAITNVDNYSSTTDECDTDNSISITEENSVVDIQNNIDEWKDLV